MIGSGNLFLLEEAIRGGADVNARAGDPNGDTPLLRAVAGGDVEMVRMLLGAGADPNVAGQLRGFTPLMLGLEKPEILRELNAAGADVNAHSFHKKKEHVSRGGTALHMAAASNNTEAVRILIGAGAQVEALDENGLAPLDRALKRGVPTETSVALVEAGAVLTPERLRAMHSAAHEPESFLTGDSGVSEKAAEILRRAPRAVEFQNRKRPSLKFYVASWLLIAGFYYLIYSRVDLFTQAGPLHMRQALPLILMLGGYAAISFWWTWRETDPMCPACGKNIQNCARNFCHDCGSSMNHGWCRKCEAADLEKGLVPFLNPSAAQDTRTIDYCPHCGVWIDSGLCRRRWDQR